MDANRLSAAGAKKRGRLPSVNTRGVATQPTAEIGSLRSPSSAALRFLFEQHSEGSTLPNEKTAIVLPPQHKTSRTYKPMVRVNFRHVFCATFLRQKSSKKKYTSSKNNLLAYRKSPLHFHLPPFIFHLAKTSSVHYGI